jgi:hypothetical protein
MTLRLPLGRANGLSPGLGRSRAAIRLTLGFFAPYTDLTFQEKVEFYRHPGKWANRMILGYMTHRTARDLGFLKMTPVGGVEPVSIRMPGHPSSTASRADCVSSLARWTPTQA